MKKQIEHVRFGHVRIETETENVKVSVSSVQFKEPNWVFYVPKGAMDKFGFVPTNIIKSRMLHDFNVNIHSYSVTPG